MLERQWKRTLTGSLFAVWLLATATLIYADEESVAATLKEARDAHRDAVSTAEGAFLELISAELKKITASGDLEETKALLAERAAFEAGTGPVTRPGLLAEIRRYLTTLQAADNALTRAYEEAVEAYTKELKLEAATAVRDEQKKFDAWRKRYDSPEAQKLLKDAVLIWTFDSSEIDIEDGTTIIRDLSDRENHGRIFGHRTLARSPGKAVAFDRRGTSLLSDKDIGIVKREPRTFAMWIFMGMAPRTRMGNMFGWGVSDHSQQFRWGFWNNRYRIWTYGDATTRFLFEAVRGWHHITMTYDGTTLLAYRNGNVDDVVSYNLNLNTRDSRLSLNEDFIGAIDEVVILARALTPVEVTELYKQSKRGLGRTKRSSRVSGTKAIAHRRGAWPPQ